MNILLDRKLNSGKEKRSVNSLRDSKFVRFQFTALLATVVDFSSTIFFKSVLEFYYVIAVGLGATLGGITAFILNRHWVFNSTSAHPFQQAIKYALVVAGSILLNTTGTYLLTEYLSFTYLISKAIVALIVGFTYSYYLSKRFVFYA